MSKVHLVLVLGQEVNSLTVILWFRGHSDTIYSIITAYYLHLRTVSHTMSDDYALISRWCLRHPHLNIHRFAREKQYIL